MSSGSLTAELETTPRARRKAPAAPWAGPVAAVVKTPSRSESKERRPQQQQQQRRRRRPLPWGPAGASWGTAIAIDWSPYPLIGPCSHWFDLHSTPLRQELCAARKARGLALRSPRPRRRRRPRPARRRSESHQGNASLQCCRAERCALQPPSIDPPGTAQHAGTLRTRQESPLPVWEQNAATQAILGSSNTARMNSSRRHVADGRQWAAQTTCCNR